MKKSSVLFLLLAFCINASFAQSVGTTEGVFNVSDLGAANYSIPIKVPDGINGMQPSLALVYNSQGGNGPLGMGWSISGLSAITRSGNTIYNDSKVAGISLTSADKFTLDGNRLIVTSGNYGASTSKYRTEVETFKDITANGTLGTGPQSFTVTDQNGWTYEYGNTADSRQVPAGKTEAVVWYLNKVKDLLGNYITYEYNNNNGEVLPLYIKYNSNQNTGLSPQTIVIFSYVTSTNSNFSYVAGGILQNTKRMNKITIYQNTGTQSTIYRSYIPEYADDFYTHLTKVTEKGAQEAEALAPTEFTYGETMASYTTTNVWSGGVNTTMYDFATGDFNGDGKTDLIQYCRNYSDCNVWSLYKSTGSDFTQLQTSSFPTPPSQYTKKKKIPQNYFSAFFDYNGDGKDDFIYKATAPINNPSIYTGQEEDMYYILLSNGSSLTSIASPKRSNANGEVIGESFIDTYPLCGDFDGDGKTETLAITKNSYGWGTTYIIGENYVKACTGGTGCNQGVVVATPLINFPFIASYISGPYAVPNPDEQPKIMVIDYNGDGKSDILYVNQGTAYVYTMNVTFDANNKPVIGSPEFKLVNSTGYPTIWHKYINVGDFNGDGKSDVLTYANNVGWEIGYGKGDGLMNDIKPVSTLTQYTQGFSTDNNVITPLFVSDFNGDGKTDIYVYPRTNSTNSTNPVILYSKGNNAFYGETLTNANSMLAKEPNDYFLGDFTGDGQMDFITKYPGNWPFYQFSFHPNETRHLLSKVKNGLGAETKVNYLPLTNSSVYTSGTNAYAYPYIKRTMPFKVASAVVADNGINTTGNTISYTYSGLKFNAQGKGLMGFDKVTSLDQTSSIKTEKSFGLNTVYAFPYLQSSTTKYNNTLINSVSGNAYSIYHYGNKRIFPYQTASEQYNALTGEYVQTTNNYTFSSGQPQPWDVTTYSNYIGKPTSITTNKGYGLEISTQTITYADYLNSPGGTTKPVWIYSKPSKIVTTNTRQGQPAYTRTATFTYDNTTGQLSQTAIDPSATEWVGNLFYYNGYGNVKDKYTIGNNVPLKQEKFEYDASNRYVTKSYFTAYPNIQNNATYDALTGNKLTETAPDGFQNTYTYDAFGRVKTSSDNNGLNVTTTYNWGYSLPGDFLSYLGAAYYTSTTSNTGSKTHILYDRLGREMKTKTNNFQNQWVSTRKTYNNKGQLTIATKPYFDNETPQNITTTYDTYGRPTQIAAPEGNTTYVYGYPNSNGCTTSSTNPAGQTTSVKIDPSGAKINTTDAQNNVLSYTYHSNGNVKSVSGAGTTLQTYTYDEYNQLKERWDPNYGTYKYTYDAYGQMLTQTDPKNQTYILKYDAIGRMDKKTGPEGDYIYDYNNNQGLNCGKMTLLTGPEGEINYEYGMGDKISGIGYYDNGLTSQITGNALSNLQIKTFTYDNFGRLEKQIHWPSNTTLFHEYGSNGDLTKITNHSGGNILYERTGENAMGQTTSYRQSNPINGYELTTDISYDPYNLLTGQSSYDNIGNMVRDMQYDFDAASGNLKKRMDNKYGLAETFSYDDLNRLTGIANTNNPALDISLQFSTRGNIKQKTDAGMNFQYDQANRVSLIELDPNLPENIPEATQELSYTPFDKVQTIDEGDYHTEFHYWPDGSRSMMATTNNNTGEQWYKIYVPGVETKYDIMSGQKTAYTYVNSPEGNVVAMVADDFSAETDYFVLTDHLGSFTQIVHEDGYIEEEKSFDAWGRLRDPQSWEPYAANIDAGQPQQLFDRGYTGHEHLPYYGIINMNGRLYDPVMGRMFSPDVNINGSDDLQGYNRYTYAANNPLSYTDPDGNIWQFVAAAVIGGVINVAANWNNIDGFGEGLLAFGVGAGSGLAAAATGGSSLGAQAVVAVGTSAVTSGTNSIIAQTDNFQGPINWNLVGQSSVVGGASGLVSFGASRGVSSLFKGDVILGQGLRLSGRSIPAMALKQGLSGAAGGYGGGFATSYLMTGDVELANEYGLKGLYLGTSLGVASGIGSAAYQANRGGYDAWTGKFTERSVRRTFNIPVNWKAEGADGDGIIFKDPNNNHNSYRFMNGNPNSPNPWQQNQYLQIKINGQTIDAYGIPLPNNRAPGSHIPITPKSHVYIKRQ